MGLLQDPRLAQACTTLAAGPHGVREIPLDGTVAPPAAFLNLLSWLAVEAAQQASTTDTAPVDGYLKGPDGGDRGDRSFLFCLFLWARWPGLP
jgi:hypothetical protein